MSTISITGISKVIMEYEQGKRPHLKETNIALELSPNLEKSEYLNPDGTHHKGGMKAVTQAFIQGLIGNVKIADQRGWWKEGAHMQYIIDELQRAFVHTSNSKPEITDGQM